MEHSIHNDNNGNKSKISTLLSKRSGFRLEKDVIVR